MRKKRSTALTAAMSSAVVAALAGALAQGLALFAPLDRAVQDAQAGWLRHTIPTDVIVVEIDARSIQELHRWPWPRRYHAKVVDALVARGAERIFLDVDFSSESNAVDDAELSRAVRAASGRLVLPTFWRPLTAGANTLLRSEPMPALRTDATLGLVNLMPDSSGLVREIRSVSAGAGAAIAPVAYVLAGRKSEPDQRITLDYRIAPSSFRALSFIDVLRGRTDIRDLAGKTVLIGATASELNDMIPVPVYDALPGVLVQALALESLRLDGLHEMTAWGTFALIALWAALAAVLIGRVRWQRALLLSLGLAAATLGFCAFMHARADVLMSPASLLMTIAAALLSSLLVSLKSESWAAWSNWLRYKRQDALLAEIVSHSADAIVTLDSAGQVRTANPAALRMFDLPASAMQAMTIDQLLPAARRLIDAQAHGRAAAVEVSVERADRDPIPAEIVLGRIAVNEEQVIALTLRDITVQKDRERELRFHATHDGLTKLPNRVFLAERLREILDPVTGGGQWALVLLDLDGFKEINDTLGHSVGDVVLIELAKRLSAQVPPGTCVARLGGDEFAVLLKTGGDREALAASCSELLLVGTEPVVAKSVPVAVGISAGVARCPEDADTAEMLLQRADIALYAAKRKRTSLEFYDAASDHSSPRRLEMLTLLRSAISNGEMSLHFQPKVELQTRRVAEVEALARWQSPALGRVSPAEFIALAEATDLITPLTHWTLRRALSDCCSWRSVGAALQVAVNLSARHLQDARLPHVVQDLLHSTGAEPEWLELEITESAIMADPDRAFRIVQALREIGISISIDDFGTGYSSLAYLQNLNIDRLKIDRSFVAGLNVSDGSRVIVASIIQLGHALGLKIVAEGIETDAQCQRLSALGCDFGQGFFFAPALSGEALLEWCARQPGFVVTTECSGGPRSALARG